jgi:hypothetical protein
VADRSFTTGKSLIDNEADVRERLINRLLELAKQQETIQNLDRQLSRLIYSLEAYMHEIDLEAILEPTALFRFEDRLGQLCTEYFSGTRYLAAESAPTVHACLIAVAQDLHTLRRNISTTIHGDEPAKARLYAAAFGATHLANEACVTLFRDIKSAVEVLRATLETERSKLRIHQQNSSTE